MQSGEDLKQGSGNVKVGMNWRDAVAKVRSTGHSIRLYLGEGKERECEESRITLKSQSWMTGRMMVPSTVRERLKG